jgi:hypothetical protein
MNPENDSLYDEIADFMNAELEGWHPRTVVMSTSIVHDSTLYPALLMGHYSGGPYLGFALINGQTHEVVAEDAGNKRFIVSEKPSPVENPEPGAGQALDYIKPLAKIAATNQAQRDFAGFFADHRDNPEMILKKSYEILHTRDNGIHVILRTHGPDHSSLAVEDSVVSYSGDTWFLNDKIEPGPLQAITHAVVPYVEQRIVGHYRKQHLRH